MLVAEALRLEYFLYRIHEFFWYEKDGDGYRVVACGIDPGVLCLFSGVGLGVIPIKEYYDWVENARKKENEEKQSTDEGQAPKVVRVRPSDGISAESSHREDFGIVDYDRVRTARQRMLIKIFAFVLMMIGIIYYITMDILYPTGL